MVLLPPKYPLWQGDTDKKYRAYCRYCKHTPDWILLLTRTQDYMCESCYHKYDILISNKREDLPANIEHGKI